MLLLFVFLGLYNCVQFPLTKRCACSEFEENTCKYLFYCSWDGSSCIEMQCKYQQELLCSKLMSRYSCKWNEVAQTCEDHKYECSELTKDECFIFLFGMDCMWQDNQCKPQDCTEDDYCNPLKCSKINQKCGQQGRDLDCSSQTPETCSSFDGEGNICSLNNEQECQEYYAFSSSCSSYEDRIVQCNSMCHYDIETQSCIPKECSQITEESECNYYLLDLPSLEMIPCIWRNGKCNEVTEEDFQTFNQYECVAHGLVFSSWQSSTSTCKLCTSFVHNPEYEFYELQMNGIEILKWALVYIALQI
ncbi:unnamed protein product [Paramecium primaurelia]|uniref:Uncharacterized protein n=1 Tax=Paramecium primaurelia TaxID=5886 RepID=A0A8S1LWY3_PARPR|nr:unnamed protein product [Paramecium primaurelia]